VATEPVSLGEGKDGMGKRGERGATKGSTAARGGRGTEGANSQSQPGSGVQLASTRKGLGTVPLTSASVDIPRHARASPSIPSHSKHLRPPYLWVHAVSMPASYQYLRPGKWAWCAKPPPKST